MTSAIAQAKTSDEVVGFLQDLFARCGAEAYLGESVTMAEHMLQAAALAERSGADDEVVVAALLHDIGHFHDELTEVFALKHDNKHQEHGATALAAWFPPIVAECVGGHVAAKRYLCSVDREYFEALSPASVHTLELQGGPMEKAEADAFSDTPNLEHILAVRRFDDGGKHAGADVPSFDHYLPRINRLLERLIRS
jgi:[1-hydroxy-2-(trimethylamino)ethyl]phosphonate dioxygenase